MPGANSRNSWSFPPSHRRNPCSLSIPLGTNPLKSESDGQFTQVVCDDNIHVGLPLAEYLAYSSGANANSVSFVVFVTIAVDYGVIVVDLHLPTRPELVVCYLSAIFPPRKWIVSCQLLPLLSTKIR